MAYKYRSQHIDYLVKQNVGLALESEAMGARKFSEGMKVVLLNMVCISGVKNSWSRGGKSP